MIKTAWRIWNDFLFQPIGTEVICIYRILLAVLVFANLMDISGHFLTWYGLHGILSSESLTLLQWEGAPKFSLLCLLPNDAVRTAYFWSLMLASISLCLGFCTTFSAGYVSMGLVSLYHYNPYISNGGDTFLRLVSIFMTFAPCGDRYSLDDRLFNKTGHHNDKSPWAQRMIQIQLAVAYWGAFWFKANGPLWWDGTAVYYATRLPELMNGPFPLLDTLWFCKLSSWSTLIVEFAAWTLIWYRSTKYYVLAVLVVLHAFIAYLFVLPYFQALFVCTLLTFVDVANIKNAFAYIDKLTNRQQSSGSVK